MEYEADEVNFGDYSLVCFILMLYLASAPQEWGVQGVEEP